MAHVRVLSPQSVVHARASKGEGSTEAKWKRAELSLSLLAWT